MEAAPAPCFREHLHPFAFRRERDLLYPSLEDEQDPPPTVEELGRYAMLLATFATEVASLDRTGLTPVARRADRVRSVLMERPWAEPITYWRPCLPKSGQWFRPLV